MPAAIRKFKQWVKNLNPEYRVTKTINSQKGQDYWVIHEVFKGKRNGFFLELGADDGVMHSNTLVLERDYGWKGICIEPNPERFVKLKKNRRCACVNCCVDGRNMVVDFVIAGQKSGIVGTDTDHPVINPQDSTIAIETRTLNEILKEQDAPSVIDYFSFDVEGSEFRIMQNFDFSQTVFHAMTIEQPSPELNQLLFKNGYVFVRNQRYDTFYIHESFPAFSDIKKNRFVQV